MTNETAFTRFVSATASTVFFFFFFFLARNIHVPDDSSRVVSRVLIVVAKQQALLRSETIDLSDLPQGRCNFIRSLVYISFGFGFPRGRIYNLSTID